MCAVEVLMRSSVAIMLLSGLAITACSKSEDKPTVTTSASVTAAATTTAATTAAATTAQAQPTAVVASADMNAFMAMLDGKDGSSRKALKKYAVAGMQNDDLGMYNLNSPKVTKAEKVGDSQCYTMESSAGVMTHTTQTCWDAKGKISKITDTSQ